MFANGDNLKLEKHFVAYLEILGYKEIIEENREREVAKILKDILEKIQSDTEIAKLFFDDEDLRIKMVSGHLILSSRAKWSSVFSVSANIQYNLAQYGIFVRGAICYDELYSDAEFIYGKALAKAQKLTAEEALYPRILIDQSFLDATQLTRTKSYFSTDFDGHIFVDYLRYFKFLYFYLECDESALQLHRAYVIKNMEKYKGNAKVLMKYKWCKDYHNRFCGENSEYKNFVIE